GGNGGCGGRGGNGGNGGRLLITADNPCLLMLVEADLRGGDSGSGGDLGAAPAQAAPLASAAGPASAAEAAVAACRAWAELAGPTRTRTWRAAAACGTAVPALPGARPAGQGGRDWTGGAGGQPGKPGYVIWSVIDPSTGEVTCRTQRRYDVVVEQYEVASLSQDPEFFFPSAQVVVTNVRLRNRGGMALPLRRRSKLRLHRQPGDAQVGDLHLAEDAVSVPSLIGSSPRLVLSQYAVVAWPAGCSLAVLQLCLPIPLSHPQLEPNEQYTVTALFHGRLSDVPTPNEPVRYEGEAEIRPTVSLVGRQFTGIYSAVIVGCTRKVRIRHPVVLSAVNLPPQMGRGEQYCVNIEVSCCCCWFTLLVRRAATTTCSCEVELRIRLDRRMLVAAAEPTGSGGDLGDPGYVLKFHPDLKDTVYVGIRNLPAKSSLVVRFPMLLEDKAELFDHVLCQVELTASWLSTAPTRCACALLCGPRPARRRAVLAVPAGDPPPGRGLLGHGALRRLQLLRDTGLRHEVTWVDRYGDRLLIVPDYRPELVCGLDLARHFTLAARLGDSAALLIAGDRAPLARLVASLAAEPAKPRLAYGCSGRLLHPLSCVGADREEA
uniref:Ig-like domain-containing protein n=1 Tax=Macrostomum lignano TaxID=282301 RepID=A0A1I8F283_9PLAT